MNDLFIEGDTVWCLILGKGTVKRIEQDGEYPVVVELASGSTQNYTLCGCLRSWYNRSLFFSEPKVEVVHDKYRPVFKVNESLVLVKKTNGVNLHIFVRDEDENFVHGHVYGDVTRRSFAKADYNFFRIESTPVKF